MAEGSITYGGEPALLDWTGDLAKILESAWPKSRWPFRNRSIGSPLAHSLYPETPDSLFESPYPETPLPELNELIIPTGASRFARSIILLHNDQLCSVMAAAWGSGDCASSGSTGSAGPKMDPLPLTFEHDGTSTTRQMFALSPQLIDATGNREIWALPLVDARYFWQSMLRKTSISPDDPWNELFASIAGTLGVTINHSEIHEAYQLPDADSFAVDGISIAQLLDAAVLSFGRRAVFDGESNIYLQTPDSADTRQSLNLETAGSSIQMGGESHRHPLPGSLNMIFRRLENFFRNCGQFVETADIDEESESPEVVTIHSTVWARFIDDAHASSNREDITFLAGKFAEDLAAWSIAPYSATFASVVDWTPSGNDDYVSVGFRGASGVTTQVRAMPTDFYPRIQLSQFPALFYHRDEGLIMRMVGGDIDPADGFALGGNIVSPMEPDSTTGVLQDRRASDGSLVPVRAWNASPGTVIAWNGTDTVIQCKKSNCRAVIDVEYCPPDEPEEGGDGGGE